MEDEIAFTEYDGMILLESLAITEQQVQMFKEKGWWRSRWQYERGANHTHGDMTAEVHELILQEKKIVSHFTKSLRSAYPNRTFVVSHIPGYAVSFYQATEDAPTEGVIPVRRKNIEGVAWCEGCRRKQRYHLFIPVDAIFGIAEWGKCTVCGNEIFVHADEVLTLIP